MLSWPPAITILGVAAADRLHRLLNRFQPGAAHQIDGDRRVSTGRRRSAVWRAGFARSRRSAPAEEVVRRPLRRAAAAFKQAAHHRRAEFDGGKGSEGAAKAAYRGAYGAQQWQYRS